MFLAASARALGQVAHFLGHHGEALAGLAGAGRFDRGVEGQQVGLEGDLVDGLDDLGGLVADCLDLVDGVGHAAHGLVALLGGRRWRSPAMVLAWSALSAFCLVIEAISSSAEEVSSRLQACSLAPSAICWLAWATWPEADDVCSAPVQTLDDAADARLILRVMITARTMPIARAAPTNATTMTMARLFAATRCGPNLSRVFMIASLTSSVSLVMIGPM